MASMGAVLAFGTAFNALGGGLSSYGNYQMQKEFMQRQQDFQKAQYQANNENAWMIAQNQTKNQSIMQDNLLKQQKQMQLNQFQQAKDLQANQIANDFRMQASQQTQELLLLRQKQGMQAFQSVQGTRQSTLGGYGPSGLTTTFTIPLKDQEITVPGPSTTNYAVDAFDMTPLEALGPLHDIVLPEKTVTSTPTLKEQQETDPIQFDIDKEHVDTWAAAAEFQNPYVPSSAPPAPKVTFKKTYAQAVSGDKVPLLGAEEESTV